MGVLDRLSGVAALTALALALPAVALAQSSTGEPGQQPVDMQMDMSQPKGWRFTADGLVRLMFNHQAGPRGGDDVVAPNWWMGMASRSVRTSQLTLTGMLSLEPATVGESGYREIFQAGEALNGLPLIDRQHPHDLFMQLAAVWRTALTDRTGFTLAGGPAGEPALGPVAFMHRPSAAALPLAPLGHHTFDSTHIAFGVVTAAVDHGPITAEASLFNGREPDQHRWNFDFGPLDSVSVRVWYRPTGNWELQASTGHLVDPEQLEPGNVERTTASAAWFRRSGRDFTALAFGYGVNATAEGSRHALFAEATRSEGSNVLSGRIEVLQVETNVLLNDVIPPPGSAARTDPVGAFTAALTHDVARWRGLDVAAGGAVTLNAVPAALRPAYGSHPVSFQVFLQVRPPVGRMGRMWNMRMARPMAGDTMAMATSHRR